MKLRPSVRRGRRHHGALECGEFSPLLRRRLVAVERAGSSFSPEPHFTSNPGSTGHWPVPPGHWPDGTENARLFMDSTGCLHRSSVPSGASPLGTGESPVLPGLVRKAGKPLDTALPGRHVVQAGKAATSRAHSTGIVAAGPAFVIVAQPAVFPLSFRA
jgi:hypothetical protein